MNCPVCKTQMIVDTDVTTNMSYVPLRCPKCGYRIVDAK